MALLSHCCTELCSLGLCSSLGHHRDFFHGDLDSANSVKVENPAVLVTEHSGPSEGIGSVLGTGTRTCHSAVCLMDGCTVLGVGGARYAS